MENRVPQSSSKSPAASTRPRSRADASVGAAKHPVLSRLMEEVRNERHVEAAYDRVHNRHNRGR